MVLVVFTLLVVVVVLTLPMSMAMVFIRDIRLSKKYRKGLWRK